MSLHTDFSKYIFPSLKVDTRCRMDWVGVSSQIHTIFSSLGSFVADNYLPSSDCLATLDEIWRRLSVEDRTLRTFRRAIGVSQVIKKDLLPLLINSKDDRQITDLTIKILSNLTMPVECLLPTEVMSKSDPGRNTIYELNLFLSSCKEAFLDSKSTRRILDHIKLILEKGEKSNEVHDSEVVNDCIILLRNILQISDLKNNSTVSLQNKILWNLFAQNMDKVLIELISMRARAQWGLALVQLIALMYKDQHVPNLQKLLNLWFESSLSESSEDNESNTSPPEQDYGDSSSSMATSDPTSDSSDNNNTESVRKIDSDLKENHCKPGPKTNNQSKKLNSGQRNKNKQQSKKSDATNNSSSDSKQHQQQHKMECGSEVSDCGYGTQVENQESISTSSNDDETPDRSSKPVHQKPANMIQRSRHPNGNKTQTLQEKQELKRKKLVRRSRLNLVKALLHHTPSDEDISHLLKEFTVDFLLKGYGCLVSQLHCQLLYNSNVKAYTDPSHFFWIISYFLKFATQLELDLEHISPVLSREVVFYLTYEGVNLSEQFELAKTQSDSDLAPCIRRMHLVVTAIRELIQAIDSYKKILHLTEEDQRYLNNLQMQISETEDLRCLFVLLLRQFTPTIQSKQYLQDVIVTNHMLLTLLENSMIPDAASVLQEHLSQFCSVDMMRQYGLLLECYQENGQFVNDCVFTMMHHVAGDLNNIAALFQPSILKTFSLIWESEFQICDDWSDMIEYVMHKFINMPRSVPVLKEEKKEEVELSIAIPSQQTRAHSIHSWNEEDSHNLYWYYVQSANSSDPVGTVIQLYRENGISDKTRIEVIEKLLQQDIITRPQYQELMEKEPISIQTSMREDEGKDSSDQHQCHDEIEKLKDHLDKNDKKEFLFWVQKVLLEACHAKLSLSKPSKYFVEPVAYYCTLLQEPIPLVPWNCNQSCMMHYQPFVLLLHKLGLHLPANAGKAFPRIPHFWTPDSLFSTASKLGPLEHGWLKFNYEEVEGFREQEMFVKPELAEQSHGFSSLAHLTTPYITYTPEPNIASNWIDVARYSKVAKI